MDPAKYLIMTLAGLLMLGAVAMVLPAEPPDVYIVLALQQLLLIFGGYLGSRSVAPKYLKLTRVQVLWGVAAGIGLFAIMTLSMATVVGALSIVMGFDDVVQRLAVERQTVETLVAHARANSWIPLFLFTVVGAAVSEELFFRGFLLKLLETKLSVHGSLFVSALLFALMHRYLFQFVPIFLAGLFLGWLLLRTKNLLHPIIAHAVSNAIVLAVAILS